MNMCKEFLQIMMDGMGKGSELFIWKLNKWMMNEINEWKFVLWKDSLKVDEE